MTAPKKRHQTHGGWLWSGRPGEAGPTHPDDPIWRGAAMAQRYRRAKSFVRQAAVTRLHARQDGGDGRTYPSDHDHRMEQLAKKAGMSVEAFREREDAHIQALVDRAKVTVQVPGRTLEALLNGGEFKTSSRGGSGTDYTTGHYRQVESHFYEEGEHPVYGVMRENPSTAGLYSSLLNYGAFELVLKDRVKPYTTFTFGDSMDQALGTLSYGPSQDADEAPMVPQPLQGAAHPSDAYPYSGISTGELPSASTVQSVDSLPNRLAYVEAQVHQGIGAGDIEEIRVFVPQSGGMYGVSNMPNEYPPPKGGYEDEWYGHGGDMVMGLDTRAATLGIRVHYVFIDKQGRIMNKQSDPLIQKKQRR